MMNFSEHNNNILKKYAGQRLQLKIAMYDEQGNIEKVFKNRYQAAKWIYDNGLSNYHHDRGVGYTIACIAGALTIALTNKGKNYTKYWKILSPKDTTIKVTEPVVYNNAGKTVNRGNTRTHRWLLVGRGKADKFSSIAEIATTYNTKPHVLAKNKKINGYSIIPFYYHPKEKTFNSLNDACRFLRVELETVKNAITNNKPIHNYWINIPKDKMEANYKAVEKLNKV